MVSKEPIVIDHEHGSFTRTQFRKLPKVEKLALMQAWFRHRYEDPVHRTPHDSAEGGYQYIYGGPYSAEEELSGQFYDLVPEGWIGEVVTDLEREAIDWTSTPSPDDYDEEHPPDLEIDIWSLGDPAELQFRAEVLNRLEALERTLTSAPQHGGIGHNNPPEAMEGFGSGELAELTQAVNEIKAELGKPIPSANAVFAQQQAVEKVGTKLKLALAHKLDIATDEFAKEIGKKAATIPFWFGIYEGIHNFLGPLIQWIHIATGL